MYTCKKWKIMHFVFKIKKKSAVKLYVELYDGQKMPLEDIVSEY